MKYLMIHNDFALTQHEGEVDNDTLANIEAGDVDVIRWNGEKKTFERAVVDVEGEDEEEGMEYFISWEAV